MSPVTKRITIWATTSILLVGGLLAAFWPQPVQIDIAQVSEGAMVVTLDDEGETRIRDVFVVSTPVTGRVRRIEAEVGDVVTARETIIAQIEPIDPEFLDPRSEAEARADVQAAEAALAVAKAQLTEARAEQEFAQSELDRAQRLIISGTISERSLDEAERAFKTKAAAVDTSRASYRMREFGLARAMARLLSPVETQAGHGECECVPVRTPVTGQILRLLHESEGVVTAGQPLVEIGDPHDLEIVVDYLSTDAVKIRPGQHVVIDKWGGPGTLSGRVRKVEPFGVTKVSALGIEEQRVNVIIDITDPAERWQRLGHGYRAETRIILWRSNDVLKLPLTSLFRDGDRWAVYVDDRGRAKKQIVQIGHRSGFEAQILEGLSAGDRVVMHPSDQVADGVSIEARR